MRLYIESAAAAWMRWFDSLLSLMPQILTWQPARAADHGGEGRHGAVLEARLVGRAGAGRRGVFRAAAQHPRQAQLKLLAALRRRSAEASAAAQSILSSSAEACGMA